MILMEGRQIPRKRTFYDVKYTTLLPERTYPFMKILPLSVSIFQIKPLEMFVLKVHPDIPTFKGRCPLREDLHKDKENKPQLTTIKNNSLSCICLLTITSMVGGWGLCMSVV